MRSKTQECWRNGAVAASGVKELELAARLLRSQSTLSLSTVTAEGGPRAVPLFYLPGENLRLYWFSSASSGHSHDLKRNAAAAVAIYRPAEHWRAIRGVQMRGTVSIVTVPAERRAVADAYVERFRLDTLLRAAMSRSTLYRFEPSWLRYIDNSNRFGYTREISIDRS
jgi:uncharacterized protein YhbP (UPF0306 family)